MTKFDSCKAFHFSHSFSVLFKKETSAAASSSSSVRRVSEQDSDYEEFPAYSREIISPKRQQTLRWNWRKFSTGRAMKMLMKMEPAIEAIRDEEYAE